MTRLMLPEIDIADGEVAVWWIGQAGFYLLTSDRKKILIDPYLSDSIGEATDGEYARLYPPPVAPDALDPDVVLLTHDHPDHLNEPTLEFVISDESVKFAGPSDCCAHLSELGVPQPRMVELGVSDEFSVGGTRIKAIPAFGIGSAIHLGYEITCAGGVRLYHTGDTDLDAKLLDDAPRNPDAVFVCINGKWQNMDVESAAELAVSINAAAAVPMHHDLFAKNSADADDFRRALQSRGREEIFLPLEIMVPYIFSRRQGELR